MRHQVAGRKLGRKSAHRWAMFRNMATSLVEKERIETTLPKAKELRPFAEHLVTLGKQNTLSSRRAALSFVRSSAVVAKLFSQLAPRYSTRNGGYTRIMQLGYRLGDSAPMAVIEYLPGEGAHASPAPVSPKKGQAKGKKEKEVKKEVMKKEGKGVSPKEKKVKAAKPHKEPPPPKKSGKKRP